MKAPDLSSEHAVVFHCVVRSLAGRSAATERLRHLWDKVDWDRVVGLAVRQGIAPMVYAGAKATGLDLPDQAKTILQSHTAAAAAKNRVWVPRTLGAAVAALIDNGIQPVVLKGAALAYTVYPQPWYRTFNDVDILVPPTDLRRAGAVLRKRGFVADTAFPLAFPKVDHHLPPHSLPNAPISVEIHHQLLPTPCPFAIEVEEMRTRSREVTLAGTRVRVPATEDELHHVCIHMAYGHRYEIAPLRGLADIFTIAASEAARIDWDLFVDVVRSSRSAGTVYWPLAMARAWLDAPIPDRVLSRIAPTHAQLRMLKEFADASFIFDGPSSADRPDFVVRCLLRDVSLHTGCSIWVQARALWRGLFPPPEDLGHLPDRVTQDPVRYLSYLIRPGRLGRGLLGFGRLVMSR